MKKYISLSFDDGPNFEGDSTMSDMLDILQKHKVPASFFLIGNKISDSNISVIKRAFDMGCDIENHSWTHPHMSRLTAEEIIKEYEKTDKAIEKITGRTPQFFRPPYIDTSDTLFKCIKVPFICGKDCRDWEDSVGVEERLKMLLEAAEDRTIFLLHVTDKNTKTLETVDRLIPLLQKEGYEFVTVPRLFEMEGLKKTNTGRLWSVVRN